MRVGEKCLSRDWVLESVALSQFGHNISGSGGENNRACRYKYSEKQDKSKAGTVH